MMNGFKFLSYFVFKLCGNHYYKKRLGFFSMIILKFQMITYVDTIFNLYTHMYILNACSDKSWAYIEC